MTTRSKDKQLIDRSHHGDNARLVKRNLQNYKKVPWCIYFYYLKPVLNDVQVRRYSYDRAGSEIGYDEVPKILAQLTVNARRPLDQQFPFPEAEMWEDSVWRRKSYIAVVIDHRDYSFDSENPIIFLDQNNGEKNYSFYDADLETVKIGSGEAAEFLPALYFINHMKRSSGGANDISGEIFYYFELNTTPRLPERAYPDSGGTNMGPPIGPP